MQPEELHKVEPSTLAVLKSHKKVFVIFGCTGDAQWADCINGLSAEWLIAAHPEERIKVNGMAWYSRV